MRDSDFERPFKRVPIGSQFCQGKPGKRTNYRKVSGGFAVELNTDTGRGRTHQKIRFKRSTYVFHV